MPDHLNLLLKPSPESGRATLRLKVRQVESGQKARVETLQFTPFSAHHEQVARGSDVELAQFGLDEATQGLECSRCDTMQQGRGDLALGQGHPAHLTRGDEQAAERKGHDALFSIGRFCREIEGSLWQGLLTEAQRLGQQTVLNRLRHQVEAVLIAAQVSNLRLQAAIDEVAESPLQLLECRQGLLGGGLQGTGEAGGIRIVEQQLGGGPLLRKGLNRGGLHADKYAEGLWHTGQMRFEPLIGLRYVRSGRGSRFISFISLMATAGIALGVAALIIVMSVMNGFQKEVRDRMLSVISHVELVAGTYDAVDWTAAESLLRAQPGVTETAPFVLGQAMVAQGGQLKGILSRGIDPSREPLVSPVLGRLDQGELADLVPGAFGVVVGREFAETRRLKVGDSLLMITADTAGGPAGIVPRMKNFTVVGIFHTGHYEYDSSLVLMHERDATALFRAQGLKGIRAQLERTDEAPAIALNLRRQAPDGLFVRDWTAENRTWFTAVQLEKRMMFLILALIIAVAAFNLVSMLVMTVMDKRADIAILRTVGAQRGSVLAIFVVEPDPRTVALELLQPWQV